MKSTESEDVAAFGLRAYQVGCFLLQLIIVARPSEKISLPKKIGTVSFPILRDIIRYTVDDQDFIEEEEDYSGQGENVDEDEEAEDGNNPSDDSQSNTDEYILIEENGNSQFKRLSRTSDDDVIFGLDDSHHSDQEMRQQSPEVSYAQEKDDSSHEPEDSKKSETESRPTSSTDSSHHSFHVEVLGFGDDDFKVLERPPSTGSNCTKTDDDETPRDSPIQKESGCLIENLTNPTLSLTINGHRPMSAPREIIDTDTPPKEVIYVDIQTVFHQLSCVSKNINASRLAMLVISFPMVLVRILFSVGEQIAKKN